MIRINTFDLGARHMDPALGRFMVVDPMADFINFQSPYAMANNNPVQNVDYYGLGIINGFKAIFRKIGAATKKLFSGNKCNCSSSGESIAQGFRRPDNIFPRRSRNRRNRNPKSKTRVTTSAPSETREPVSSVPGSPIGININFPQPIIGQLASLAPIPPTLSIPEFNGTPITAPIGFDRNIEFQKSKFELNDTDHTEKTLNDLIKTLKEYPQLKVLILGNASFDSKNKAKVNGNKGKYVPPAQKLQLQRARAVEQFLINRGINWRRINVGTGEIRFSGTRR